MLKKKPVIGIIGSGFAGLAASSILASGGCHVDVFEKNPGIGGRARQLEKDGFLFDMGPSWYWMPDVYEQYFNLFGKTTSDFYELKKLDPGFTIIFDKNESIDVPADFEQLCELFEHIEAGAASHLRNFMDDAEYKYQIGMGNLIHQPGLSVKEFLRFKISDVLKLQIFSSFKKHVRKYFKDPRLIAIVEFPILFLGAASKDTPALYSLMNYAGLKVGTFYPMGGFGKVVEAFKSIAESQGVNFQTSANVEKLEVVSGEVKQVVLQNDRIDIDAIIGSADYHHIENNLLSEKQRSYPESYWESRTFAPSCLIFYLGVNKRLYKLNHHNLFFDKDIEKHTREIYSDPVWPTDPLFYVCCPSKTDPGVAPEGCENLFILMPVAAGLRDSDEIREHYYGLLMQRLENYTGDNIRDFIIFKESYSVADFVKDYNAYKGNAYGLANTLFQTAVFKPKLRSKKVSNLFFAGQLTVPGPGVPPSIISGRLAATEVLKFLKS